MNNFASLFRDFSETVRLGEPLARHTSFRVGGPADVFACPASEGELSALISRAKKNGVPVFVIGAGANILVRDKGFRGLVVSLEKLNRYEIDGTEVRAGAGCPISLVAEATARAGLKGLERFFSMPGSIGGSVWMNARCYERSVSDALAGVRVLDAGLAPVAKAVRQAEFNYKKSPFQTSGEIILEARFALEKEAPERLQPVMEEIQRDREGKGHFSAPSAGSVFKNNRAFGMPTGRLIDSLGLKGYRIGGAEISPRHANIIVNMGNATAADISALISYIEEKISNRYGFTLEREIIYVGDE